MITATQDCGCVPGKITQGQHPKCFESHSPEVETGPRYTLLRCQTTAPPPSCPNSVCCRPFRCGVPASCPPTIPPCPMMKPPCPMTRPPCPPPPCPPSPCPRPSCPSSPCPRPSCPSSPSPRSSCPAAPSPRPSCSPPSSPRPSGSTPMSARLSGSLSASPRPSCPPTTSPRPSSCPSSPSSRPSCPPSPCPPLFCPPTPCSPTPCLNFGKIQNCSCSPEPPVFPDLPDDCVCGMEEPVKCKVTPEGECDPCCQPKEDKVLSEIAKKGHPYKEIEAIINNNRMVIRMQKEPVEDEFEPPCDCPDGPGVVVGKRSNSKEAVGAAKGCGDEIVYEMSDFARPGYTTGGQSSLLRHSCDQKGKGGRTITMYPHPGMEQKTMEDPEEKEKERREKRAHDKARTIRPIDLEENPNIFVLRIRKISNTSEGKQKFDLEFRTPRPWMKREKTVPCPGPTPPLVCQLPSLPKPKAKRRCAKGKKKKSKKKKK